MEEQEKKKEINRRDFLKIVGISAATTRWLWPVVPRKTILSRVILRLKERSRRTK